SCRNAPINLVIRIWLADNSSIVWVYVVHRSRCVEEAIAIDRKRVSMDLVRSGLQLILGDTLPKAIFRGEAALHHREFPNQIKRRIDEVLASLDLRECDRYSVEYHLVLKIQSAVNASIGGNARHQSPVDSPDGRYSR